MATATKKKTRGRRYGDESSKKVEKAMHEMKRGQLRSGGSGTRVKSRKQAIAIGLAGARRAGGKVPAFAAPAGDDARAASEAMAARTRASASISFGLVTIPVGVYPAVNGSAGMSFHLLHKKDGVRLRQQFVCPQDGEVVPPAERVKGYEFEKGRQVTLTDEELRALRPGSDPGHRGPGVRPPGERRPAVLRARPTTWGRERGASVPSPSSCARSRRWAGGGRTVRLAQARTTS